jgi:hypothetical protein
VINVNNFACWWQDFVCRKSGGYIEKPVVREVNRVFYVEILFSGKNYDLEFFNRGENSYLKIESLGRNVDFEVESVSGSFSVESKNGSLLVKLVEEDEQKFFESFFKNILRKLPDTI